MTKIVYIVVIQSLYRELERESVTIVTIYIGNNDLFSAGFILS